MKKSNVALWGTGLVGALICIVVDMNYANVNNSAIGMLGMAGIVAALACAYFFFDGLLKGKQPEKTEEELAREALKSQSEKKRIESLEKKLNELILVEKAVYTMAKKEAEEREAAYEKMGKQLQETAKALIYNQEKAVKVMISYNRDNSQNASSAVSEEIVNVQRVMAVAQKHLLAAAEEMNHSISDNTTVLENKLKDLEASIKNMNISVAAVPAESFEPKLEIPEPDIFAVVDEGEEAQDEEIPVEEDIMSVLEPEIPEAEEEAPVPEPEPVEVPIPEPEPVKAPIPEPAPVADDPNRAMTPDEIAALIASVGGGTEEEAPVPEPEPVEVPIPEPEPVKAPIPEPAPVADDPNRAMTPDEIAALIASVGGGTEEEAPVPEPEPVKAPIPEPAPVADDPNRAMSPDEIAALIASMN